MIGNAVPVRLARSLALEIHKNLGNLTIDNFDSSKKAFKGKTVKERMLEIVEN